jgi:radical SAM protein with 4Fe4S-binding SPASM domain
MKLTFFDRLPSYKAATTVASLLTPAVNTQRLPRPFLVTFVVTHRCNARCQMCNLWREKDSSLLSLEQIQRIFGRDDFSFVRQLVLTGGEPTLRSDLPELFEIIRAACPNLEHVELATNGLTTRRTLECVERMVESIKRSPGRINRFVVQVSLDGIGDVHDGIRGISGAYRRACETLDGLGQLEKRYPILRRRLSSVIMPQNLAHVEPLQAFARERGFPIYFSPAVVSGEYYRNLNGSADLTFISGEGRNEEAVKVFEALAAQENSGMCFYYEDVSHMLQGAERSRICMMGFYGCIIEHDGAVYPCVNFEVNSFGNLLEQSFDEVWFGPRAEAVREEVRCIGCPTCVGSCYTLPINAGEMIRLVARRLTRVVEPGHPPSPGESKDTHEHTTGLLGHSELEP